MASYIWWWLLKIARQPVQLIQVIFTIQPNGLTGYLVDYLQMPLLDFNFLHFPTFASMKWQNMHRKSSIRRRLCIILYPDFPRLVL